MRAVVIDTDVASRYLRGDLPEEAVKALSGNRLFLTFVTVGELLSGARHARWGERRLRALEDWIKRFPQVDSSPAVSEVWGKLVAERRHAGREMKPNDAWIAACCIAGELPLATFNRKDFEGIEGLELLLP